jgi:hypothetical protein
MTTFRDVLLIRESLSLVSAASHASRSLSVRNNSLIGSVAAMAQDSVCQVSPTSSPRVKRACAPKQRLAFMSPVETSRTGVLWMRQATRLILWLLLVMPMAPTTAVGQQSSSPPPDFPSCGTAFSKGHAEYWMVYRSEQAVVCVDKNIWNSRGSAAAIAEFFPYFDQVILLDKALFQIRTPQRPFVFEITVPFGGAHTGCDLRDISNGGRYCDTVTGDAFSGSYSDPVTHKVITGFFGYVLPLHESINVYTGLLSDGWPSDWWADHRSPFPNAMDIAFMLALADNVATGSPRLRSALRDSAHAQWERFGNPGSVTGQYDPQVAMFLELLKRPGGFEGYKHAFYYAIGQDHLQWPSVSKMLNFTGDDNHSENLSEYVIAYLELGFGTEHDMTSVFRDGGVGTLDKQIPSYKLVKANIKAVADAHCSIRAAANAGIRVDDQLRSLQLGNFTDALAQGGTSESCPAECTFREERCEAKF